MELRSPLGEDNKTIPPFKRILMAGRSHTSMQYMKKLKKEQSRCGSYKDCYKETMAIPFVAGRKAEHEKFAGAEDTYTIEALMHDGKALQSATSHFFGNGFPDAFGIKYVDKNNELHSAYETSWDGQQEVSEP